MTALPLAVPASRDRAVLAGWGLLGLFGLFMIGASAAPKFAMTATVADGMARLGWDAFPVRGIGALEVALTVLVVWPRTGALGGVLMTGLLGGTIATHLQAGSPLPTHTLFGIYLGALMWGGLLLRDARLRAFLPWR